MHCRKFLFILFILFLSCSSSTREEIKYYENGNIESVIRLKNNLREGKAYFYFEDGTLSDEIEYKNGKMFGYRTSYYRNGEKDIHAFKIGDLKFGWCSKYDSIGGILRQESEFLIVPPEGSYLDRIDTTNVIDKVEHENQRIVYKKNGQIDTLNSYFFTVNGIRGNSNEKNEYNKGEIKIELK